MNLVAEDIFLPHFSNLLYSFKLNSFKCSSSISISPKRYAKNSKS